MPPAISPPRSWSAPSVGGDLLDRAALEPQRQRAVPELPGEPGGALPGEAAADAGGAADDRLTDRGRGDDDPVEDHGEPVARLGRPVIRPVTRANAAAPASVNSADTYHSPVAGSTAGVALRTSVPRTAARSRM